MPLYGPDGKIVFSEAEMRAALLAAIGDQTVAEMQHNAKQLGYALDTGVRRERDFTDELRWSTPRQPATPKKSAGRVRGKGKRGKGKRGKGH